VDLHIRRIEKARDFVALAPVWSRVVGDSGQTAPFLSHDWFWCCWHGVWPQRRPEILLVEEAATPIAIIPLMRWRSRVHGLPIRHISFLEWPYTPAVDLLTVHRHDEIIALLLEHLSSRSDWDIARLQKLPAGSPTVGALEQLLPGRLPWRRDGHQASPYVAIDGDWDRFCRSLNSPFSDPHQHLHAQLRGAGDFRLEEHRLVDLESSLLREMFACMHSLDRAQTITSMPRQWEFFRVLSQRAAKNGWLSLWTLKLNGHIIAIEYQLRSHGRVEALLAGEDPAFRHLLPWSALNLAILQTLFQSGCATEYRVGPAMQSDRLWQASGHHQTVHLKLYRPSLYARIVAQLEGGASVEHG
jgi:CelD/BcsL family acetyltransferase involved in cellulose biosynthesis